MPLLDTGVIGPTIHTATTYDGLSRDPLVVSDGDGGLTDDGLKWHAKVEANKNAVNKVFWLPADIGPVLGVYNTNANGPLVFTIEDALADFADPSGAPDANPFLYSNSVTKAADALAVVTGASGASAWVACTPTSSPSRGLILLRACVVSGAVSTGYNTYAFVGNANDRVMRFSWSMVGTLSDMRVVEVGGNPENTQGGDIVGPGADIPEWWIFEYDFDSGDDEGGLIWRDPHNAHRRLSVQNRGIPTGSFGAYGKFQFGASFATSNAVMKISDFAWWEY